MVSFIFLGSEKQSDWTRLYKDVSMPSDLLHMKYREIYVMLSIQAYLLFQPFATCGTISPWISYIFVMPTNNIQYRASLNNLKINNFNPLHIPKFHPLHKGKHQQWKPHLASRLHVILQVNLINNHINRCGMWHSCENETMAQDAVVFQGS